MPEETKPTMELEKVIPSASVDLPLKIEHITDIIVAQKEEQWLEESRVITEEINRLNSAKTNVETAMNKALKELHEDVSSKLTAEAISALTKMGYKHVSQQGTAQFDHDNQVILVQVTIKIDGTTMPLINKKITAPKNLKAIAKEENSINQEIRKASITKAEIVANLNNIDRVRRMSSAKIGVAVLQSSETGRNFLNKLLGKDKIKLLSKPE